MLSHPRLHPDLESTMTGTEPARRHRDGHAKLYDQTTPIAGYSYDSLYQPHAWGGEQLQHVSAQHDYQLQSQTAFEHLYSTTDQPTSTSSAPSSYRALHCDWGPPHATEIQQTLLPHLSVENSSRDFSDWSLWDQGQSQSIDAHSYRSSPHLAPHHSSEHRRASSISSHASFGPQTPRPGATFVPRVEVYDSEGTFHTAHQNYHWPDELQIPVSDEEVKHFCEAFGAQEGGGHLAVHNQYRHLRDAPRPQDSRIRQLMMSQESNGSSRMGPPALPRTESTDTDSGCKVPMDGSLPKLDRTMSDIYQDSLYNPNLHQGPSTPPKSGALHEETSPNANMMRERLAAANNDHLKARSQSPTAGPITRQRSPFKEGAPESPRDNQFPRENDPISRMGSAYRMREWQKAQRDRVAAAQHSPAQMKAELNEPKTISPKEVALDYEEDEIASKMGSLFPEEPPVKRRKQEHSTVPTIKPAMTRESTRGSTASEVSQPSFASMATSRRESSQSNGRSQMNYPFFAHAQRQASNASIATATTEATNEFPATLTPTDSTRSDHDNNQSRKRGLRSLSTQEKSQDTDAAELDPDELTYTCTYHGCTKRFDSQSALQKHKRDIHHSTAHHSRNTSLTSVPSPGVSSRTASASVPAAPIEPATDEPDEDEEHAASADEIADRNSQAGPHICNRINPSTGRPCNSHFSRPYDLTRHEDTIHNNRKQKVRCMYCKDEKTFSRNDALTRHMRVVHPDIQFPGKEKKR